MKYMLMFWDDDSAEAGAEVDAATLTAIRSWVDEMTSRGIRLHGSALSYASEAAIVRVRNGEMLISDGPYAETKEQVGGYDVIECADLDAAIKVAAAHPLASMATVEVRPMSDFPG
ncbi:MAG TPA: YciI family protein [Streptosporangiaceae bacterium]|nr:YciI family protein [Streptosporangiaceae bacterium]